MFFSRKTIHEVNGHILNCGYNQFNQFFHCEIVKSPENEIMAEMPSTLHLMTYGLAREKCPDFYIAYGLLGICTKMKIMST